MDILEREALLDAAELLGLARSRLADIGREALAGHIGFCLTDIGAEVQIVFENPPCQMFAPRHDIGEAQVEKRPWFGVYKNPPQA